jgi:uncharacterized membrane protein YphA (DoxX/SURF4 family)
MLFTLARIFACGIWLFAGLYKATHFKGTTEDMAQRGIPMPAFFLVVTLAIEFGGTYLLFTNSMVWLVSLVWIAFVIVVTPVYHGKVLVNGVINFPEYVQCSKNLSIIGAMFALMALDPAKPAWLMAWMS